MLTILVLDEDLELAYQSEKCPVSLAIARVVHVPYGFISIDMYGVVRINNSKYWLCDDGIDLIDDWENGKVCISSQTIRLISL